MEDKLTKSLKTLAIGILLLGGLSLCAASVDVSGVWDMTMTTPRGERETELTIEQDGDTIKVTMPGFRGDEMTGEGTVTGNKIEWTFTIEGPQGEMTMIYAGTIEGDTMTGEVEIGEMGTMEWTAKKK